MTTLRYPIFSCKLYARVLLLILVTISLLLVGCNEDKAPLQITGIVYDAKNQTADRQGLCDCDLYACARHIRRAQQQLLLYGARHVYRGRWEVCVAGNES